MALETVGNVVATVLRRSSEHAEMAIASLHPFCVRLYFEHLLPASNLNDTDLPVELSNTGSLLDYLKGWNSNVVTVTGEEGNWSAKLVQPCTSLPVQQLPIESLTNTANYTVDSSQANRIVDGNQGEDVPMSSSYDATGLQSESISNNSGNSEWDEISFVRQLLCTTLLDYVLHSKGAVHYNASAPLEETRSLCIQLLVSSLEKNSAYFCLRLDVCTRFTDSHRTRALRHEYCHSSFLYVP